MNIEKLCKNIDPNMREEVISLAKSVEALKAKLDEQTELYESQPLTQTLTTTQGEKALKANPAVQEYRATVKDYAAMLGSLMDLVKKCEVKKDDVNKSIRLVGNSKWKKQA